jgi:hypothetical protein
VAELVPWSTTSPSVASAGAVLADATGALVATAPSVTSVDRPS